MVFQKTNHAVSFDNLFWRPFMLSPKAKLIFTETLPKLLVLAIVVILANVLSDVLIKIMLPYVEESYHPARSTDRWNLLAIILGMLFMVLFHKLVRHWKWLNNDSIERRHIILRKILVGIGFVLGLILIRVIVPYDETYLAWSGYGRFMLMMCIGVLASGLLRFWGLDLRNDSRKHQ
jgi:hypothetical protein